MDADALTRTQDIFGLTFDADNDLLEMPITRGEKFAHVIAAAPLNRPNEWIMAWEDFPGGGDMDHNDLVFQIMRVTGGSVKLNAYKAISPAQADAYFTGVTLDVYDRIVCPGDTQIKYFLSIDNGDNWVEITEWDAVYEFTLEADRTKTIGANVSDWTPGNPEYTYRSRRVDFAGLGLTGRELTWRAELISHDPACRPEIVDISLEGTVATHGTFSRAAPVVKGNVLYSGYYETPAIGWTDKVLRGHLTATRLYDPTNPDQTDELVLWDAGQVLSATAPSARNIKITDITVVDEQIGSGDGSTRTFSGTLAHYPVSATTLVITDLHETFHDEHTDVLTGSLDGSGTINRFTGEFEITFDSAPVAGVPIRASYSYYTASSSLLAFTAGVVTNAMLAIDDTPLVPTGYVYDFDEDGNFDEDDGDWLVNWVRGYKDGVSIAKEWPLEPIDHSVPAVATPPGLPLWYFGTAVAESERTSFLNFKTANAERRTVVYVGSRGGMLHAFDGGKFRHGDNERTPDIEEQRGYFLWEDRTSDPPSYCDDPANCPDYGSGEELWAFIPANVIPRLKNNRLQGEDQAYVDASPALADVFINGSWKTVLLAAQGNGGDTVFALDVTNPDSPTFLWEFADPDLFRSRSSPAVAQIGRILVNGTTRWIAFFVSGKTYDATLYPSVYMIDIADGSVVQRVFLDAEPGGVGGVPSGQPAVIDSDGNGFIDRLYIGTDKGFVYKINIPDDPDTVKYGISHCVINRDFSDKDSNEVSVDQRNHPIYASPVVLADNGITTDGEISYNIMVFFGTGDSPYYDEDINTTDTNYHFFAYRDTAGKGLCDEDAVSLDWFLELPAEHRVFASAFAAGGNIYFGTSTSETEDPCEGGGLEENDQGSLYAFDFEGTPVFEKTVGNVIATPLVEDEHLYIKSPSMGLQSFGSGKYNNRTLLGGIPEVFVRLWREVF